MSSFSLSLAGETIPESTMKGRDAMFSTLTDTAGSSVSGFGNPALTMIDNRNASASRTSTDMARNNAVAATGTTDEITASRAETAVRLILMADRKLSGKTLGIIGYGPIGRETARRAHLGFGMNIVIYNRSAVPEEDLDYLNAKQVQGIDRLLGRSDFVSLHCTAATENHHLIDALRLNMMKPDAHLINTAGRELVDEEALADALWYGTIAGAGLNATTSTCDRIRGCENVVLLPCTGSSGQQACAAM